MRKLNQKGFTIIELLVVIVIIGILVALTLPNLFAAQARGRDTDRKNELKNVQTKLETYFGDNGNYPTDFADAIANADVLAEEQTGPKNDAYTYTAGPAACDNAAAATNCNTYTLTADLENNEDKDAIDANGTYQLTSTNQ